MTNESTADKNKRHADGGRYLEPIEGSRFFRAWCKSCGEPMRVTADSVKEYCSECGGPRGRLGSSNSRGNPDIEWGGYCDTPINE